MSAIQRYIEALERLKIGKPTRIKKPYKINNDSVALEAGNKRGAIKKSREEFADLVEKIKSVAIEYGDSAIIPLDDAKVKLDKKKAEISNLNQLYQESLGRELSLTKQIYELKQDILELNIKLAMYEKTKV